MQLSSKVTKGAYAIKGEKFKIATEYSNGKINLSDEVESENFQILNEEIINEGKREKEKIILEAMEEAARLEEEAYKKGYEQGFSNGIEDARTEANETIIKNALEKSECIVRDAEEILNKAKLDYKKYIEEKELNIKELAFTIAEKILNKKIEDDEYLIGMIDAAIAEAKSEKTVLIRCNEENIQVIEAEISRWKLTLGIKEGIFTIKEKMPVGEIIIEKETGNIKVGIETGLEKLKEELLGKDYV